MTASTPGREELIHSISHLLSGHSFALITGGHHEEMASKIVDRVIERLAAKPAGEGARDKIIKILKSQAHFSQLVEDVSAFITNAPELTDKILAAFSTTSEPKQ